MTDHCSACQIARELLEHRDATAAEWSVRRGTLNFARIVAERACPAYVPATENPALNKGSEVDWGQQKTAPGARSANCEQQSQGLARRYEGAPN